MRWLGTKCNKASHNTELIQICVATRDIGDNELPFGSYVIFGFHRVCHILPMCIYSWVVSQEIPQRSIIELAWKLLIWNFIQISQGSVSYSPSICDAIESTHTSMAWWVKRIYVRLELWVTIDQGNSSVISQLIFGFPDKVIDKFVRKRQFYWPYFGQISLKLGWLLPRHTISGNSRELCLHVLLVEWHYSQTDIISPKVGGPKQEEVRSILYRFCVSSCELWYLPQI